MSRIGKLPVVIPEQIKVELSGSEIKFNNGKLSRSYVVRPNVEVVYDDDQVKFSPKNGDKSFSIDVGMDRSNVNNIVLGLIKPFEIILEVNGVGYKALVNQKLVVLNLGYSHEIFYNLPEGVSAVFEKPNIIKLNSHDKVLVGQVASEIIAFRKPEPYKGKGVKIAGSKIVRKEGKKK
jgi:large subunit ribosomal protein L6